MRMLTGDEIAKLKVEEAERYEKLRRQGTTPPRVECESPQPNRKERGRLASLRRRP